MHFKEIKNNNTPYQKGRDKFWVTVKISLLSHFLLLSQKWGIHGRRRGEEKIFCRPEKGFFSSFSSRNEMGGAERWKIWEAGGGGGKSSDRRRRRRPLNDVDELPPAATLLSVTVGRGD